MIIRLIVMTAIWCTVSVPDPSEGSVISLFIEAQKQVITREEALLNQAQEAVKDRIDQAFDKAHEALMNVAEQVHYYATYPFRAGNEMVQNSMSRIGNATASLAGYLPFFGGKPTESTSPESIDEASFISRVQRMREQISRLSGLHVVVHTVSEDTANGPLLEIGFGNTERTINITRSGNATSEQTSKKPISEIHFDDNDASGNWSSVDNETSESTSYGPLMEMEFDDKDDTGILEGRNNEV